MLLPTIHKRHLVKQYFENLYKLGNKYINAFTTLYSKKQFYKDNRKLIQKYIFNKKTSTTFIKYFMENSDIYIYKITHEI